MNIQQSINSLQAMADKMKPALPEGCNLWGYLADLDVAIAYEHSPAEEATRDYPGCDASIEVCSILFNSLEMLEAVEADTSHVTPKGQRDSASLIEAIEDQCWEHLGSQYSDDGYGDYLYDMKKDRELEEAS